MAVLLAGAAPGALAADLINLQLKQSEVEAQLTSDNVLLFAVELDTLTVSESLAAYGDPQDPLVPLGELARLLDLDIEVAPASGQVNGFVGEARRPLSIDIPRRLIRVAGRTAELGVTDLGVTLSDVYVRASSIEKLLPISLEADGEGMLLRVVPREKLPIQARLERVAKFKELVPEGSRAEAVLSAPAPYRAISAPAFDVSMDLTSGGGRGPAPRYDVRTAGDLLGFGYQAYVGTDERGGVGDARVLFERRDAEGGLLGPLNLTAISAGDVFTPGLAIGPRSHAGRGFSFSTADPYQTSVFDRIDLRGELPAGSDVELYVNDVLRGGQRGPVGGRYEFLGVPLVRGSNAIRIVTYGARGEKSEETRIVNVGGGQLRAGQSAFDFGLTQQGQSLLKANASEDDAAGAGATRAVASLAYGVSTGLTLVGGAGVYGAGADDHRSLGTLGVRTSLFGVAVQADAASDQTGGSGYAVGLAAQRFGVSAVLRHAQYRDGLVDETYLSDRNRDLLHHTELTADTAVPLVGERILPLTLRLQRQTYADDSVTRLAAARVSTTVAGTLLSTGVDLVDQSSPDHTQRRASGVVAAARTAFDGWQLRGSVDYELGLIPGITSGSITADREISDRLAMRFGMGEVFGSEETSIQAGALFRTSIADVTVSSDYTADTEDLRLGLRLAFGIAPGVRGRRYALTRPGPAAGASARFHAFVDENGNGLFDADEPPMPEVTLEGGERAAATAADGRTFVTGLGSGALGRLQVGLDKVEDPFLTPPPTAIEFAPRPGLVIDVAYPLTPTGEVLARIVVVRPNGRPVGVSAMRVRLVAEGRPAMEATTEFDGSAIFQQLRPGRYALELDREQAERLGMRLRSPVQLEIEPGGGAAADVVAEVVIDTAFRPMLVAGADPIADLLARSDVEPSADLIGDLLTAAPTSPGPVASADRIGELLLASGS